MLVVSASHDDQVHVLLGDPNVHKHHIEPPSKQTYRVLTFLEGEIMRDTWIQGATFVPHHVQSLDGDVLIACGRCRYRGEDTDKNGRIYSNDGQFLRALTLGDGIEHLQTDEAGEIWVGYFDEGVFGNYGWNEPLGASGLVRWNADGEKTFEFFPSSGLDQICDCYALNVSGNDTWLCYYTDFPLVRIRGGKVVESWPAPIQGSTAFAVGGRHILFRGGYGDSDKFYLCTHPWLGNFDVKKVFSSSELWGEDEPLVRCSARGPRMIALFGTKILELNVDALA